MIDLKNKKVVVFGLGVSGISALKLLNKLEAITYAVNAGNVESWAKSPGVLDFCFFRLFLVEKEFLKGVAIRINVVHFQLLCFVV